MNNSATRWAACAVAASLAGALVAPVTAAPTRQRRASTAVSYIAGQQRADGSFRNSLSPLGTTADSVIAFVAAKRGKKQLERSLRYLANNSAEASDVGSLAKLVLAAVAGGRNPRDFGGRDLVADIDAARQPSGQIGLHTDEPGDPEVFGHALGMLAFAAAREPVGGNAVRWLTNAQCRDGGWQYDDPASEQDDEQCSAGSEDFALSDSNTTSIAVQALSAAGGAARADIDEAFAFFAARRDPEKRGWGYDPSFTITDANSTALVIQAYVAADRDLPKGAMRALVKLQRRLCGRNAGAFAFTWEPDDSGRLRKGPPNLAATIAAIPALKKKALPLAPAGVAKPPLQPRAC